MADGLQLRTAPASAPSKQMNVPAHIPCKSSGASRSLFLEDLPRDLCKIVEALGLSQYFDQVMKAPPSQRADLILSLALSLLNEDVMKIMKNLAPKDRPGVNLMRLELAMPKSKSEGAMTLSILLLRSLRELDRHPLISFETSSQSDAIYELLRKKQQSWHIQESFSQAQFYPLLKFDFSEEPIDLSQLNRFDPHYFAALTISAHRDTPLVKTVLKKSAKLCFEESFAALCRAIAPYGDQAISAAQARLSLFFYLMPWTLSLDTNKDNKLDAQEVARGAEDLGVEGLFEFLKTTIPQMNVLLENYVQYFEQKKLTEPSYVLAPNAVLGSKHYLSER